MSKTYHTINYVLNKLSSNKKPCVVFEKRPAKYKFGVKNYGEIPGMYNKSDGDPWDVFAPGYNVKLKTNTPYEIDKVIGIFVLENGNHKIAIRLREIYCEDTNYENRIINDYCKKYMAYTKIAGKYISFI